MKEKLEQELFNRYDENISNQKELIELLYKFIESLPRPIDTLFKISDKEKLTSFLYIKILEYSKDALYNLIFISDESYKTILRKLVENYIIILGIIKGDDNTWKRYQLQSYYHTIKDLGETKELISSFNRFRKESGTLDITFKQGNFDYSWLSTENKKITSFKSACDLLEPKVYDDYRYLCNQSHSVSLFYKYIQKNTYIVNSISIHYTYLYKIISMLKLETSEEYEELYIKLLNHTYYLCEEGYI